jgi:hypothetical protein
MMRWKEIKKIRMHENARINVLEILLADCREYLCTACEARNYDNTL